MTAVATKSALLIPVDPEEPIRRVDVEGLYDLQELVGGDFDVVATNLPGVTLYINANGKPADLRFDESVFNPRATQLAGPTLFAGDWIAGPMVVIGFQASTGADISLREGWEDTHIGVRRPLPAPDETQARERGIHYRWRLREETDPRKLAGTVMAEFSVAHVRDRKLFVAVLDTITVEGSMVSMKFGGGALLHRWPCPRFSAKRLGETFADGYSMLQELYGASDPRVTAYFATETGGAL